MSLTTLEIKPNRLLLDSNFDGYKLSLEEIKVARKHFHSPVYKTCLNSSQYSLLHAKLFGLHNHFFGDQYDSSGVVYFINSEFDIQKCYVDEDQLIPDIVDPFIVFTIPKIREQHTGDYNVTLCFASAQYAVMSDGMGTLYILATNDKKGNEEFDTLFSEKVLENEDQGFIIADALYNEERKELHVLTLHIQEDIVHRFVSIIHWITLKESENNRNDSKDWGLVALRQLKTKGEVQYLHLEKNCEHIYVVSESELEFVLNSEHPIKKDNTEENKVYKWSQNLEEISVKFPLLQNTQKDLIKVSTESTKIEVVYDTNTLLSGDLSARIDASLTTWALGTDNTLEITLIKNEGTGMWPELVKGDQRGEYHLDSSIIDQVNNIQQAVNSESEGRPQCGTTFNSQQIEECDFETDKSETFERISSITNKTTHRIHLGSHQILLSPHLNPDWPPALGIRHDVDVCLWQPIIEGDSFNIKHEGTLLAMGYVQASKQNRKFTTCSPNLNYAVISESSGHIFIYRQNKPLLSSELRQRSTGRRVRNVAQQQVFNLPNQEILGIYASNKYLFVLEENYITALTINDSRE